MPLRPPENESILASLRRMALIGPDEVPAIEALTGGISSLIVLVQSRRGPLCLKRALAKLNVAADWRAPVERSNAEVDWIRLVEKLLPRAVPRILGHDPEGLSFAMAYIDPETHPVWKAQLRDGHIHVSTASQLGEQLAVIHNATAGRADLARQFANDEAFSALRLDAYFLEAGRRNPVDSQLLTALVERTVGNRLALIHGDVSPKNILEGADGPIILDAETACYGDPAFDLAFCLNHLLLKCVWRPPHIRDYLRCFEALRNSYLARVGWESSADLEARACNLLGGLLLARVDGKSPVEYITADAPRARIRGFALQLLRAPMDSLAQIQARWGEIWG